MSSRSPGRPLPQRCQLILQHCLAIQLSKPGNAPGDFWMYDSGYLLFQSFLAANAKCWWTESLAAATAEVQYAGYVSPGVLLVCGSPRALETLRGAYARSVLKPPPTYLICGLGDIDDCIVTPAHQGQFTPLPEALCDVIMDLTTQGDSATMESIKVSLSIKFPTMESPSDNVVYDTLAQLMHETKIYQTARGYFIVTPERRRSRSHSRNSSRHPNRDDSTCSSPKTMLMSDEEALHSLYGEISTIRDGAITHQNIQTNLADVICGGNPNDKVLYGRPNKRRSASFPTPRSLDRRHSLRIFGSSNKYLQRCASSRSLHNKNVVQTTDSSSSTDYPQSIESTSPKKVSLLSRLFRRSGRSKQPRAFKTFSAQFPPTEWFNSKAVHLHCVATQTNSKESLQSQTSVNSSYYDESEISNRSSTLPRRQKRHFSTESGLASSIRYEHSPIRHSSPSTSSLPRSILSRSSMGKPGSDNRSPQRPLKKSLSTSLRRDEYANSDTIISTSGPSSLESTVPNRSMRKSKPLTTSLENQTLRRSYRANYSSGHSSLDSHISDRTVIPASSSQSKSQNGPVLCRAQSLVKVQSLQCSPKSVHKYRGKPPVAGGDGVKNNRTTSGTKICAQTAPSTPKKTASTEKVVSNQNETSLVTSSNGNNSFTLKVTTNTSLHNGTNGTNTKVYVQSSPARSVITLENGKQAESCKSGSNVYIVNNDEVVSVTQNGVNKTPIRTSTEKPPPFETYLPEKIQTDIPEAIENKFNKNSLKDSSMNNYRKFSLQLGNTTNNGMIYKNFLNNSSDLSANTISPAIQNNILSFDTSMNQSYPTTPTKSYDNLLSAVGGFKYQKNTLSAANESSELKSVELLKKAAALQLLNGFPSCNSTLSTESLANLFSKGSDSKISVLGSEPNLALNNHEHIKDINLSLEKLNFENKQKRYSFSQEGKKENHDAVTFPSFSDLSFNFTSLAAQKILNGASINSIDTLVELNMENIANSEKQNNHDMNSICKDYAIA